MFVSVVGSRVSFTSVKQQILPLFFVILFSLEMSLVVSFDGRLSSLAIF